MSKPTPEEVLAAQEVLEWLRNDTEENEPYAVSTIETLNEAYMILGEFV